MKEYNYVTNERNLYFKNKNNQTLCRFSSLEDDNHYWVDVIYESVNPIQHFLKIMHTGTNIWIHKNCNKRKSIEILFSLVLM